jgi:hypothetical protein
MILVNNLKSNIYTQEFETELFVALYISMSLVVVGDEKTLCYEYMNEYKYLCFSSCLFGFGIFCIIIIP